MSFSDIQKATGTWDVAALSGYNFSRYIDARDTEEFFDDSTIYTMSALRRGYLARGPVSLYSRRPIRINPDRGLVFDLSVEAVSDSPSLVFAGIVAFNDQGHIINTATGSHSYVVWSQSVHKGEGRRSFSVAFDPSSAPLPVGTSAIKLAIELNYGDPSAISILSDLSFRSY